MVAIVKTSPTFTLLFFFGNRRREKQSWKGKTLLLPVSLSFRDGRRARWLPRYVDRERQNEAVLVYAGAREKKNAQEKEKGKKNVV